MPARTNATELARLRADMQRAVDMNAAEPNQIKAAEALGVPRHTYLSRLRRAELEGIKPGGKIESLREERRNAEIIRELRAELDAVHRENISAERVREAILGLAAKTPAPPRWLIDPPRGKAGRSGVPHALWSDWHWGEVVAKDQVHGINEFNLTIARARARRLVEKTIDLCFNHMTNPRYPGIVVALGGDMMSGDIHEELTETNEIPSMPALLDLFGVLASSLEAMADRFGHVFVPCVVGNHGRTTRKPRAKNRVYSNFDWLLYGFLERHFATRKDDRLRFMIPAGTDAYYRVHGHRYLLTHGDALGVKGGDGIIGLLGPVMRGDFKTRRQQGAIGQPYDTLLMGHWHNWHSLRQVIVNGSLKGYDEYAHVALRAWPEPPIQGLWFTHPDHGITATWPIYLDDKPREAKPAEWVTFKQAA